MLGAKTLRRVLLAFVGQEAPKERHPNWLYAVGISTISAAVALLGIYGFAYHSGIPDAVLAGDMTKLNPLWPLHVIFIFFCIGAQLLAANCGANLDRFKWSGGSEADRRAIATNVVGIVVAGMFAAYGADTGYSVVAGAEHRAAVEQRSEDRKRLQDEIRDINTRIATASKLLPNGDAVTSRQEAALETYRTTTAADRARLPIAQQELSDNPALSPERQRTFFDHLFLAAFIIWGALEPFLWLAKEQGRKFVEEPAPPQTTTAEPKKKRRRRRPPPRPAQAAEQSTVEPSVTTSEREWVQPPTTPTRRGAGAEVLALDQSLRRKRSG